MATAPLTIVYLLVVLYALCYQLQAPLEPFLVEQLVKGPAAASYAKLQSFFSLVQMVGSFVVGYLLDVVGLRGMFALNFVACAVCYGMLASATSIEVLFASKLPALFQAGFLCAQTAAAKLTPDGRERSTALGRLTSAYTVGGVIGPALGGYLGTQAAARLAVVGSLIAVGLVLLLPKAIESAPTEERKEAAMPGPEPSWTLRMRTILPIVWPLLASKMVSGFINSAAGAVRPLVLKNEFNFSQERLGFFMSAMFAGNAILGLRLGSITALMGGMRATILACLLLMGIGYSALTVSFEPLIIGLGRLTPNGGVWLFMGLTLLLSLFQFPMATTITAVSTSLVPPQLKGTLVGAEHATFALAGLLAPAPGVSVLELTGLAGFTACAATTYFLLFLAWRFTALSDDQVGASPAKDDGELVSLVKGRAASPSSASVPPAPGVQQRRKSPRRIR